MTPDAAGLEIRRLLLALRAPEHGSEGDLHHGTDSLRRRALEVAGICWRAPGEMAPKCGCAWSFDDPAGAP